MADWSSFLQGFANAGGGNAISRALIGEQKKDPLEEMMNDPLFQMGIQSGNPNLLKLTAGKYAEPFLSEYDYMPQRKTDTNYSLNESNIDRPEVGFNLQNKISNDLNLNNKPPQLDLKVPSPNITKQAQGTINREITREPENEYNQRVNEIFTNLLIPQQPEKTKTLDRSKYLTEDEYNQIPKYMQAGFGATDLNGETVYVDTPYNPSKPEKQEETYPSWDYNKNNRIDNKNEFNAFTNNYNPEEDYKMTAGFQLDNDPSLSEEEIENARFNVFKFDEREKNTPVYELQAQYNKNREIGMKPEKASEGLAINNLDSFEGAYQNTVEVEEKTNYDANNLISGYLKNDDNITSAEKQDFADKTGRSVNEFYQPKAEQEESGYTINQLENMAKAYNRGDYGLSNEIKQLIESKGFQLIESEGGSVDYTVEDIKDTYIGFIEDGYDQKRAYDLTSDMYDKIPPASVLKISGVSSVRSGSSSGDSGAYSKVSDFHSDIQQGQIGNIPEQFENNNIAGIGGSKQATMNVVRNAAEKRAIAEKLGVLQTDVKYQDIKDWREVSDAKQSRIDKVKQEVRNKSDQYVEEYFGDELDGWNWKQETEKPQLTIEDFGSEQELEQEAMEQYNTFMSSDKMSGTLEENKEEIIQKALDAGASYDLAQILFEKMKELEQENKGGLFDFFNF